MVVIFDGANARVTNRIDAAPRAKLVVGPLARQSAVKTEASRLALSAEKPLPKKRTRTEGRVEIGDGVGG